MPNDTQQSLLDIKKDWSAEQEQITILRERITKCETEITALKDIRKISVGRFNIFLTSLLALIAGLIGAWINNLFP